MAVMSLHHRPDIRQLVIDERPSGDAVVRRPPAYRVRQILEISGLGDLVDLRERRPLPVQQVVRRLVDDLRPYLEEIGDWDQVRHLVDEALRVGSSASRQRASTLGRLQYRTRPN